MEHAHNDPIVEEYRSHHCKVRRRTLGHGGMVFTLEKEESGTKPWQFVEFMKSIKKIEPWNHRRVSGYVLLET